MLYYETDRLVYPLAENTYTKADNGKTLPVNTLSALSVVMPETKPLYLTQLSITQNLVSIAFSTDSGVVLLGTYSKEDIKDYTVQELTPTVVGYSGRIAFSDTIDTVEPCLYMFSDPVKKPAVAKHCIHVESMPLLRSISVKNKVGRIDNGFAVFSFDANFDIKEDENGVIVIGILDGIREYFLGPCDKVNECPKNILKRINDVAADENGKIIISAE